MHKITVNLAPPYTALVERGALGHASAMVRKYLPAGGRVCVITCPSVRRHWGARLEEGLGGGEPGPLWLSMPDGERFKTLATLERLADEMAAAGADRGALVLAVGGGLVGDVAGFLASVYMRGVNLVQVPTTLVAMIDSALGGKTAVNLACGKNLLGTFHHPRAILVDPLVLATLPEREFRSGLAEAIKYGIIGNPELFAFIETRAADLLRREPAALEFLIAMCLREKATVVEADEREGGLRRILNFGHTFGHALESATEYRVYRHGEAVAWGMIAAIEIALRMHRLEAGLARRLRQAILAVCAPLPPVAAAPEDLLRHAARDKKRLAGEINFVLPVGIGKVEIVRQIPDATLLAALRELRA